MEEAETSYAKAASGTYETIEDRLSAMSMAEHDIESAIKGYESLTFGEKESGVKNYFDDIASGLKETQTLLDFDTAIGEHVAGAKISTGMILITNALNSLRDASGEIDADHIRSIGLNISEWEDDPITGQQKAYLALRHALKAYGLEVENAIPVLRTYGLVSKGNSEMLGEATTAYTKAVTEQSAVIAAMKTTTSHGSIDLETYKGLVAISRDYANCLTIQNGAIKINRDALEKLSQERAEERLQTIESNRVAAEDRYEKNSAQINKLTDDVSKLRDSYSSLTPELKEKLETDEATISKLKESNKEIAENIEQYHLMAAAVRESISAYAEWERAQGESQAGSQHKAAITGWKAIKDAYTKKEYGNTALIEGLEFLTGDDSITGLETSAERVKAIDAAYKKVNTTISGTGYTLQSFLAEGRTGANNFLNAVSQLNKEWASFDYATNTWTLDYDNAELAAEMGTTEDFIVMMNNLLELYGFDFESSQLVSSSDSIDKVADKMSALREFTGHAAEFSNGAEMFKDAIQTINDSKLSDSEKAAELGELKTMLDEWVSSTNQPAFMDISKDQVAEPLRAGLSILQEYQNVANKVASLNILGDAGMNVSTELNNAQKSLDSMLQQLASLSPDVLSGLGFDLKGIDTTKIGSIIAAIRSQIPALEVPIIPVSEFDKQAGIYYTATVINPPGDVDLEARYHVKMVGSIPGVTFGQTQASGTVPSIGDAMAGGGVGRAPGGKTLMGELGREMYVDPATNTWRTVGDNGAEFVNLPKNAIVFNHRQTASLLSNGRTRARGRALVSGNAAVMINEDIAKRDKWMQGINSSIEEIHQWMQEMNEKMDKNNAETLKIRIENMRSTIIDFASYVSKEKNLVTREQFNRVFKIYEEYESIIEANGLTNGEVDIAIHIIRESYENHLRDRTFIEDSWSM